MANKAPGIQKAIWPAILVLWVSLAGHMPVGCAWLGKTPAIAPIDLSNVPDGRYLGTHQIEEIDYEVEVTISGRRISGIRVLKGMQRVFLKKCALCNVNDLIWEIIERQSLDIDAVSGATQTSIAIRHAISDALKPPHIPQ